MHGRRVGGRVEHVRRVGCGAPGTPGTECAEWFIGFSKGVGQSFVPFYRQISGGRQPLVEQAPPPRAESSEADPPAWRASEVVKRSS